jgi:PAS domain S-box-containing protein
MALAMLLAQGAEGLSGGAGWVGAGLLGAVLAWVFMKHLPAKDTQLEKLISDKDIMIKELVAGHAKSIREVVGHCEEDAEKTRTTGERWHSETMEALRRLHESTREGVHVTRNVGNQIVLRQRLADAMQSLELPAWTKSLDGTLMSWNGAAERMLGWKAGEVVGQSVYKTVIPESRRAEESQALATIAAGQSVEEYETERVARDGRLVLLRVVTSPVRDQSGRVVGASTVAHSLDAG